VVYRLWIVIVGIRCFLIEQENEVGTKVEFI